MVNAARELRVTKRMMFLSMPLMAACADPGRPHEIDYGTSTGDIFDDGAGASTAASADDGADTTGGGPRETQTCLVDDDPEGLEFGFKYQCDGRFKIDAQFTFTGGSFNEETTFIFGHEMGDDTYEDPQVMACCRAVDPEAEHCDEPHLKACAVDMIEQGCLSLGPNIETEANKRSGIVKDKMLQLAAFFNSSGGQEACKDAMFIETGLRDSAIGCGEPRPQTFLEGAQFVANHGVTGVSPVTFTMSDVEISDFFPDPWHGQEDEVEPVQCASDNENNMLFFTQSMAGPDDTKVKLDSGSVVLSGSINGQSVEGDGELLGTLNECKDDHCSRMAFALESHGPASLMDFVAISLSPAEVGTSTQTITLDRFRFELWEKAVGIHSIETGVVFPPGAAQFIVSTSADNACYGVIGVNETPIQFKKVRNTYWSASSFTIVHIDGDDEPWELVVMPTRWR